jgi:hypothetical protein
MKSDGLDRGKFGGVLMYDDKLSEGKPRSSQNLDTSGTANDRSHEENTTPTPTS